MRLYAHPYDPSAMGFYFESVEEYERKFEEHLPVEEYEIDFIDGSREEQELFHAAGIMQATVPLWFEVMDELDEDLYPALFYQLSVCGLTLEKALAKLENTIVIHGTAEDATWGLIEAQGGVSTLPKETLDMYFDVAKYTQDREFNGEVHEFKFAGETYTEDGGGC